MGLRAISVEFTMAAREDKRLAEQLEIHGDRLRAMMNRLIERSQLESSEQSNRLGAIFWISAIAILTFSLLISTWFSVSVSVLSSACGRTSQWWRMAISTFRSRLPARVSWMTWHVLSTT